MLKICNYCKKSFNARRSTIKYCSVKCQNNGRVINLRGKKFGYWEVLYQDPKKCLRRGE